MGYSVKGRHGNLHYNSSEDKGMLPSGRGGGGRGRGSPILDKNRYVSPEAPLYYLIFM